MVLPNCIRKLLYDGILYDKILVRQWTNAV